MTEAESIYHTSRRKKARTKVEVPREAKKINGIRSTGVSEYARKTDFIGHSTSYGVKSLQLPSGPAIGSKKHLRPWVIAPIFLEKQSESSSSLSEHQSNHHLQHRTPYT